MSKPKKQLDLPACYLTERQFRAYIRNYQVDDFSRYPRGRNDGTKQVKDLTEREAKVELVDAMDLIEILLRAASNMQIEVEEVARKYNYMA